MNYLIGKKKRTINDFFLILSEEREIYDLQSIDLINNRIDYDNNYNLEEDEWFGIQYFSTTNIMKLNFFVRFNKMRNFIVFKNLQSLIF